MALTVSAAATTTGVLLGTRPGRSRIRCGSAARGGRPAARRSAGRARRARARQQPHAGHAERTAGGADATQAARAGQATAHGGASNRDPSRPVPVRRRLRQRSDGTCRRSRCHAGARRGSDRLPALVRRRRGRDAAAPKVDSGTVARSRRHCRPSSTRGSRRARSTPSPRRVEPCQATVDAVQPVEHCGAVGRRHGAARRNSGHRAASAPVTQPVTKPSQRCCPSPGRARALVACSATSKGIVKP